MIAILTENIADPSGDMIVVYMRALHWPLSTQGAAQVLIVKHVGILFTCYAVKIVHRSLSCESPLCLFVFGISFASSRYVLFLVFFVMPVLVGREKRTGFTPLVLSAAFTSLLKIIRRKLVAMATMGFLRLCWFFRERA